MEFFINDPNFPRLAPADTRLVGLTATPDPDGRRIRVNLEITPFQQRPEIEIALTDPAGNLITSTIIIEPVSWKLELTLHIRKPGPTNEKYTLSATLLYPELGEVDRRTLTT
jgi:hypothetical protein